MTKTLGKINAIQTLGTLDGPGIRFVLFLQGCNLKCGCCHNPETQNLSGGEEYTPAQILEKVIRYREYFGETGGITVSGGEPLLQAKFVKELFLLCHQNGINTCIDTSGSIINDEILELLDHSDHVLLDIKYTTDELYKTYAGCSINKPLEFLKILNSKGINTILRQVIIPTLNDNEQNIMQLNLIAKAHKCVKKIELLPFKKLCVTKYEKMGIPFPFAHLNEPTKAEIDKLTEMIKN